MRTRAPGLLLVLAGVLALYLVAPLLAGVEQARTADWGTADQVAIFNAAVVSVLTASVSTAIITVTGVPLGYLLARREGRGVRLVGFLVQLPLALPPLASGVLLLFLVGYSTPLGQLLKGWLTDSFAGIVLAQVFVAAPFLIIAARSGFAAVDPAIEGVAATLGRRPLEIFSRVSLPIAWPAILAGMLLTWLRAFGEFGATVMVAYHPYSLPIYTYVAFGGQGLPSMLPVLLPTLLTAFAVMAASTLLSNRRPRPPAVLVDRLAPHAGPWPAVAGLQPPASPMRFNFTRRTGAFSLDVAWSPTARRLAILGASGSGKSLTLKLIAGLEAADTGSIVIGGEDRSHLDPADRSVAYVPQAYGLFPHMTVLEHLAFPLGSAETAGRRLIERLDLEGLERRRPAELSLGQQQRVALARALVRPAELLLLDEPFSALDTALRRRLRQAMLDLQSRLSATTILVTHDPWEAALLADEILVLDEGQVLQAGQTRLIFQRPATETVARLLGAESSAVGVAVDDGAIAIGGGVVVNVEGPALLAGQRFGWSFPPSAGRSSPTGLYEGVVESAEMVGLHRRVMVRFGDVRLRITAGADTPVGGVCRFDISPEAIQVWPII